MPPTAPPALPAGHPAVLQDPNRDRFRRRFTRLQNTHRPLLPNSKRFAPATSPRTFYSSSVPTRGCHAQTKTANEGSADELLKPSGRARNHHTGKERFRAIRALREANGKSAVRSNLLDAVKRLCKEGKTPVLHSLTLQQSAAG